MYTKAEIEDAIELELGMDDVRQWLDGENKDIQEKIEGALDQAQGAIHSGEMRRQLVLICVG